MYQCPCAAEASKCSPCGAIEEAPREACNCAPKPNCPPCALASAMKKLHGAAAKEAKLDAQMSLKLFKETEIEAKLFQQAEKYAKSAFEEEENARKFATEMQQHASKAQIARNKMQRVPYFLLSNTLGLLPGKATRP